MCKQKSLPRGAGYMIGGLACIALATGLLLLGVGGSPQNDSPAARQWVDVMVGGKQFTLEVADTPAVRTQGLSWRSELADNHGMVFVFPNEEVLRFWMVDCLIDLDIIYLDAQGYVINSTYMPAEPLQQANETRNEYYARLPRYLSSAPAKYAIELTAGTLAELDFAEYPQVQWPITFNPL